MIKNFYLKQLIYNVYDVSRVLFNDYYNGKDSYAENDIEDIKNLIEQLKAMVEDLENELVYLQNIL